MTVYTDDGEPADGVTIPAHPTAQVLLSDHNVRRYYLIPLNLYRLAGDCYSMASYQKDARHWMGER